MKPRNIEPQPQNELFKVRLVDLIDLSHPLCRLSTLIDWQQLDAEIAPNFSDQGAPALPTRLVAGLIYLQHAEKLSDEAVVERWVQNPYWQYFCGERFFQHQFPCDPSSLTRWRKRLGETGCEWLLASTINAGLSGGAITKTSLKRVVVDTTVQEKNITFPTDSQLYYKSRKQLVDVARELNITLRQTYQKEDRMLAIKVGRYAHAKQFRRMKRAVKKLKGHLGRVYRDLLRKLPEQANLTAYQQQCIHHAARLLKQTRNSKNKLYSLHAPEVDCISKGKSHKRYEFGVKASIATTLKECFVVGARSFSGNPYDGHTLSSQLEQVSILSDQEPEEVYVDRGYKGHQHEGKTKVYIAGQKRGMGVRQKTRMNRRNSVEPVIGHLKSDGKLNCCYLKGELGDALNVILCGAGHNIRKLLRWLYFALIKWLTMQLKGHFCLKNQQIMTDRHLDQDRVTSNLSG
jgi:IS5 family transposase